MALGVWCTHLLLGRDDTRRVMSELPMFAAFLYIEGMGSRCDEVMAIGPPYGDLCCWGGVVGSWRWVPALLGFWSLGVRVREFCMSWLFGSPVGLDVSGISLPA